MKVSDRMALLDPPHQLPRLTSLAAHTQSLVISGRLHGVSVYLDQTHGEQEGGEQLGNEAHRTNPENKINLNLNLWAIVLCTFLRSFLVGCRHWHFLLWTSTSRIFARCQTFG